MRHSISIFIVALLIVISVVGSVYAETINCDVTYPYLLNNMLYAINASGDVSTDDTVVIDTASVWKQSEDKAGFNISGENLLVYGEADIDTGIITKLLCRLPWVPSGINLWSLIMFSMSGEQSFEMFFEKYVDDDGFLIDKCQFPNYAITLYVENEGNLVFELVKTGSLSVTNEDNAVNMREYIEALQK